jgi:hypothetical protein
MKKKVFCGDCVYCDTAYNGLCNHPDNVEDDWYGRGHNQKTKAWDKNDMNRCPSFRGGAEAIVAKKIKRVNK